MDNDEKQRTAYYHFNWLHWLHTTTPDCPLLKDALDTIAANYPDFEPREYPDLTHWIGRASWDEGPHAPWSVDELLSKPPVEWLPKLLPFGEPRGEDDLGRNALSTIGNAARQEPEWGIALAAALAEHGHWESNLWGALMRAWSDMEMEENQHRSILGWLEQPELHQPHSTEIADVLYGLVKQGGKPPTLAVLPQANLIAAALWPKLPNDDSPDDDIRSRWIDWAINHPGGVLAGFWVEGFSLWRKQQDPEPDSLTEEYRQSLSMIVQDQRLSGRLGRAVLAGHLAFLLAVDKAWTQENILPAFEGARSPIEAQVAWDGFLTVGRLSSTVVELLEPTFLKATHLLRSDLADRLERFVGYYTAILVFTIDDPVNEWIPSLFHYGGAEARYVFASAIESQLRDLDEGQKTELWQRWLERYWRNRLENIPDALDAKEIESMLEWLPHLESVFPEAVHLATQMQIHPLQRGSLLYELQGNALIDRHQEAMAQLLIHLGRTNSPIYMWHNQRGLIDNLLAKNISPELAQGLRKLIAELGLEY